jgi:hypothetical protein
MELEILYQNACNTPSDINEHVSVHRKLAEECNSVVEIGVRSMVSTWGLLSGLRSGCKYTGVDLNFPPEQTFNTAKRLSREKGVIFNFIARDDMIIEPDEIGEVDMMFIDSLHTYCHLTFELERFSHLAKKYLTFHDSSSPWNLVDDNDYHGDYSEYPATIDKSKRGVWTAIVDFLQRHPEWKLKERKLNNHGFTILERVASLIHGITFSIPEEKLITVIPNKLRMMSLMVPGKLETYIYETEEEYYKQYQESCFAITTRKRGVDCLRHYEIIANGCLPVFPNIEQCPAETLSLYPKQLQIECNELYSESLIRNLDDQDFRLKYDILVGQMITYLREKLTTIKVARYILNESKVNPSKILFIGPNFPDYLNSLTLHGFKTLFGRNCHDFPKVNHLYKGCDRTVLYGKGITYSGLLDHDLHDDSLDNYFELDSKIINHYFDIVIYGGFTRNLMFYNSVLSNYDPSEIIYLNGEDEALKRDKIPNFGSHMFVRELA